MSDQQPSVVHFDLKPANILFHEGVVKVTDLGICKIIDQEEHTKMELTSPGMGTYWYLPPELFQSTKGSVSEKIDIWSVGVIFYELLYG